MNADGCAKKRAAAGEDRTPDLRIMRPTRCQLRYCRLRCVLGVGVRCVLCLFRVLLWLGCLGVASVCWRVLFPLGVPIGGFYRILRFRPAGWQFPCKRPRGVTVSTLDSESSDRGSNPREVSMRITDFVAFCVSAPWDGSFRAIDLVV